VIWWIIKRDDRAIGCVCAATKEEALAKFEGNVTAHKAAA